MKNEACRADFGVAEVKPVQLNQHFMLRSLQSQIDTLTLILRVYTSAFKILYSYIIAS